MDYTENSTEEKGHRQLAQFGNLGFIKRTNHNWDNEGLTTSTYKTQMKITG